MNDRDYIDATTYTRAESITRLDYGDKFNRDPFVTNITPGQTTYVV